MKMVLQDKCGVGACWQSCSSYWLTGEQEERHFRFTKCKNDELFIIKYTKHQLNTSQFF